jgi:hypothetical protein
LTNTITSRSNIIRLKKNFRCHLRACPGRGNEAHPNLPRHGIGSARRGSGGSDGLQLDLNAPCGMLSSKNAEHNSGQENHHWLELEARGPPSPEAWDSLRGATLLAKPSVSYQRVQICPATIERLGLWREACSSSCHRGPHRSSTSGMLQWKAFLISYHVRGWQSPGSVPRRGLSRGAFRCPPLEALPRWRPSPRRYCFYLDPK